MHIPDQESRGHISPLKTYLTVWVALLILTGITYGASYVNWGGTLMNVIVAVIIATVKAALVLLYFMHMKHESRLVWGYGIVYPLLLFALLLGFSSIDVFLRVIPTVTP
ncbi:MAG: cytochrome C oxidase subunit IV family protein [Spirochaetales bacterium]|nr:cytochrome C oxidase subunit IV family protein [Spirochaetales bacterium]